MRTLFFLALLISAFMSSAQTRQASPISLSLACDDKLGDWDHERSVITFNTASQQMVLVSDLIEILDKKAGFDLANNDDINGLPVEINCKMSISDLDYKSSANNGETFPFATVVKCNGMEKSYNVPYTFFFAPRVAESNMNGAPLCQFRVDFILSFSPADFNLPAPEGCDEIVIKVQDALLNKVN
jgi:hypothetical protein